ncbi:hydrophobin family protein [Aspergillus vadensis CBS 113365]|uniref:Hydrophobin n=1 Tax=Aspergillus vadensis (strain CBS 113365 / IMI 142717 / IBT 24658) TaxID=1448311 RepID=A0A319B068_ASPVC|nr:hypothetical protein BO88DRAFT_407259 [Aspergillus vadensis CBS 113365]PYH65977.1 hypothetical protein BO88DRAFT_407259 [Aspergillus vadensis CBS 113365]
MKFAVAAILGFAMTAVAIPAAKGSQQKLSIDDASGQCSIGDIYCCNPDNKEDSDGVLTNALREGLLIGSLVNGKGSACAPTSLIEDLDLLAFFEKGQDGDKSYCKNTIACCPNGSCAALDGY